MKSRFWQRFLRHRLALWGMGFLVAVILLSIFAPYVAPYDPYEQDLTRTLQPPSREHWLGTDAFGRDNLTRILYGGRVSLTVSVLAVLLAVVLGAGVGIAAGYYRGVFEYLLMRVTDIYMSLPGLFIILLVVALFGPGLWMTIVAIGLVYWPTTARIVRAEFFRVGEEPYVEAARALGASAGRQVWLHYLPNAMAPIIVQVTLMFARAIVLESGLSYLGLGAQPPIASWGNILADGHVNLRLAPWIATTAGVAIWCTSLALNLIGDALRDSLDPTLERR